jgi:hypothetical protein
MNRMIPALISASLLLPACGDSSSNPAEPAEGGSYSANVTGDLTASLSGSAFFGTETSQGETGFVVVMGSGTSASAHAVILGVIGSGRPATGTYAINDEDGWTAIHTVGQNQQSGGSFLGASGTVTITESTAQRVKGSFQYVASGFLAAPNSEPGQAQITVTGQFSAVAVTSATLAASVASAPAP